MGGQSSKQKGRGKQPLPQPLASDKPLKPKESKTDYNVSLHSSSQVKPSEEKTRHKEESADGSDQRSAQWRTSYRDWSDVSKRFASTVPRSKYSSTVLEPLEIEFCKGIGLELLNEIGKGSFATVMLCIFTPKDPTKPPQQLACKVLDLIKYRIDPNITLHEAVDNMLREADIVQDLKHRNVVKFEHVFHIKEPETGFPFIKVLLLMELCDGDVSSLLSKQLNERFSELEAKAIMRDVCKGLQYLHDNSVVHLDINPNNILYSTDNSTRSRCYKLADFGVATRFESRRARVTSRGGHPAYRAPELDGNTPSDAKSADIFSLGTVLTQLLVGFDFVRVRTDLGRDEGSGITYGISLEAASLIRRMTFKRPQSRLTIDEVRADDWIEDDEGFDRYLSMQKRL